MFKILFDLDGTLTAQETLPLIAKAFNIEKNLEELTRQTIDGRVPFIESFISRVKLLATIPHEEISDLLVKVPLHRKIVDFITQNTDNCSLVTGNIDLWVKKLAERVGCEVHCSSGEVVDGQLKLTSILDKSTVVENYKAKGYKVIYIGDGNNDAEAMRLSDYAIACGLIHEPAASVMDVATFAVYNETAMIRLLERVVSEYTDKPTIVPDRTVILSCAGIGSRLGLGVTKSLLPIHERSLIDYHLSNFVDIEDLRIVVGYQRAELINEALTKRSDIIFVLNHRYFETKSAYSLFLGSRFAHKTVLAWDGDFIIHPADLKTILSTHNTFLGCIAITTSNPVLVEVDKDGMVVAFDTKDGPLEWSGPAQVPRDWIIDVDTHLYELLAPKLPAPVLHVEGTDIDTQEDYQRALKMLASWDTIGSKGAHKYYINLATRITKPTDTRNKALDSSIHDERFIKEIAKDRHLSWLELGAGTGLMTNKLAKEFVRVLAVEKYPEFATHILPAPNVDILIADLNTLQLHASFDLVTLFGVMNYFNVNEALNIYTRVREMIAADGTLVIKNQMGTVSDVIVDERSKELETYYFSHYRSISHEQKLLESCGFKVSKVTDIYPDKFNRWDNTRFTALTCECIL